jgi:hypothetical protein
LPQGIYVSLAEEQYNSSWDMATIRTNFARIVAISHDPAKANAHTLRHTFALNYLAEYPGDVVGLATRQALAAYLAPRLACHPTIKAVALAWPRSRPNAQSTPL